MYLRDRIDAGGRLAHALLQQCKHLRGAVVLALPRGGVPVAEQVAKALKGAELDVLIVRKIGAPGYPEYGIGAIAEGGYIHINQPAAAATGATAAEIQAVVEQESRELSRRVQSYRGGEPYTSVAGRPVVIVDDGLATGVTAEVAVKAVRAAGASRVILAIPVASPDSLARFTSLCDDIVCLSQPMNFHAVGQFYADFSQTLDTEVQTILRRSGAKHGHRTAFPTAAAPAGATTATAPTTVSGGRSSAAAPVVASAAVAAGEGGSDMAAGPRDPGWVEEEDVPPPVEVEGGFLPAEEEEVVPVEDEEVLVKDGTVRLPGMLTIPPGAVGVAVFAHGSGSSRNSPRNIMVAEQLNAAGVGTLLFDLLTPHEAADRANVFDIQLLAKRVAAAVTWLHGERGLPSTFPIGVFGASTGGGAGLWAAADLGDEIAAVVSRGGRPDLAMPMLARVRSPVLLLVGGADTQVLALNRLALEALQSGLCPEASLHVVPGATHLFEEAGALEEVAAATGEFFRRCMAARRGARAG